MIDGKSFFDQPVKKNKVTGENIRKIATGQEDDYTTGCLLDYIYFKNYYKMIVVDLSKQQDQMLILKQFNKLILQQIQIKQEVQESISFLKKQKKLSQTFHKELKKFCKCNSIQHNFVE